MNMYQLSFYVGIFIAFVSVIGWWFEAVRPRPAEQETFIRARNVSGHTIESGAFVYIHGVDGNMVLITDTPTAFQSILVAENDILDHGVAHVRKLDEKNDQR